MSRLVPTRPRHRTVALGALGALGALVVLAVLLLSPVLGRAPIGGQYRPALPPDGLVNGCHPLPGGLVPDFAYVLRRDGDTLDARGIHRRVVLQFDRIDAREAVRRIEAQAAAAAVSSEVTVRARDFDVPVDAVVRGEMVIDAPATPVQPVPPGDPVCEDPNSTKRFTPDLLDRS